MTPPRQGGLSSHTHATMPLTHTVGIERKRATKKDDAAADPSRGPRVVKSCAVSSRSVREPDAVHRVVCGQNECYGLAEYRSYAQYGTPDGLVGDITPFDHPEAAFHEASRRRAAAPPTSPRHVYAIVRFSLYDTPHETGDYLLEDEDFLPSF